MRLEDFEGIIFDFDGVVIESAEIKTGVFAEIFADHAEHVPRILELHERLGGISRFVKFEMIHREILDRPYDQEIERDLAERFLALALEKVVACPMVAGARDVLDACKGARPTFVCTGTPQDELEDIIDRRSMHAVFDELHGSPRTKPVIIRDILQRYGWVPDQVLFIGDAWSDYDAAQQTGVMFLGRVAPGKADPFPDGTPTAPDLTALAAG